MTNHEKYCELLSSILENAKQLKDTALLLLKNTESPTKSNPNPKQSFGTHSQHFIYLALEELGKFFLVLHQYDKNLEDVNFVKCGFYSHDEKIKHLGQFTKFAQSHPGSGVEWTAEGFAEKARGLKEANVYIDYLKGVIIKPSSSKGPGMLVAYAKILATGITMTELALKDFSTKPLPYIRY